MTTAATTAGYLTLTLATVLAVDGCGNQMLRQASHQPLSSPRAAPPPGAVPLALKMWDSEPQSSFQDEPSAQPTKSGPPLSKEKAGVRSPDSLPFREGLRVGSVELPPPNLSDDARNQPAPRAVDALQNPLAGRTDPAFEGRTIYLNRCTQCHDLEGHGEGPVGRYLIPGPVDLTSPLAQRRSDGALYWYITMGVGKMPGFRNWTNPYQRWSLVNYVRALKHAPGTSTVDYPRFGSPDFEKGWNGPGGVENVHP